MNTVTTYPSKVTAPHLDASPLLHLGGSGGVAGHQCNRPAVKCQMGQQLPNILVLLGILFPPSTFAFDHQYHRWSQTLQKYLTVKGPSARLNYQKLQADPHHLFQAAKEIAAVKARKYAQWTYPQRLAFLINAYNIYTVQAILQHYPIKSIKEIKSGLLPVALNNPWKKIKNQLLGQTVALDHIEHGMLRKLFHEPRIHFAINCASIGCPALAKTPYTAQRLEKMLSQYTDEFMRDFSRNRFDEKKRILYLSKIFDWFAEDFIKKYGTIQKFALPYYVQSKKQVQALLKQGVQIQYTDYNWGLNE